MKTRSWLFETSLDREREKHTRKHTPESGQFQLLPHKYTKYFCRKKKEKKRLARRRVTGSQGGRLGLEEKDNHTEVITSGAPGGV